LTWQPTIPPSTPTVARRARRAALLVALVLLTESFGRDVWWLRGNRLGAPA
jgi:hypothetical protein